MKLTHKMEDVLSALWELERDNKVVRVRDLELFFGIKTSSVIDFLRALKKRELVNHEKYGYIELTEEGQKIAKKIQYKRNILKRFFIEVLRLKPSIALKEACAFEHYIKEETLQNIVCTTDFVTEHQIKGVYVKDELTDYLKTFNKDNYIQSLIPLYELKKEETAIIEEINVKNKKLKIFNDMGFVVGRNIKFIEESPLGDPLIFQIEDKIIPITKIDSQNILVKHTNKN